MTTLAYLVAGVNSRVHKPVVMLYGSKKLTALSSQEAQNKVRGIYRAFYIFLMTP
jgi:hypothetical protein